MHCEISVKLVFHEILWKKDFTVYPSHVGKVLSVTCLWSLWKYLIFTIICTKSIPLRPLNLKVDLLPWGRVNLSSGWNLCWSVSVIVRSSLSEVFLGKGVPKICSKFTREYPCRSAISIKVQSNFAAYLQNTFS